MPGAAERGASAGRPPAVYSIAAELPFVDVLATMLDASLPLTPGEPRQREFAFRAGVNIVMYTLTGNYKADQVHVPAILERLGQ